jgi:delta-aminolevulinic acid dehydratase/porphobilinogen synthase
VPQPSAFEFELDIEKTKIHKLPGINQIPAKLIKAGVEKFALRSINLLSLFGIRRNCLRSGRSRSLHISIRRAIKQIVVIIGAYHFCQLRTEFYPTSCCKC